MLLQVRLFSLTSTSISEFCSAQEAKVPSPSPYGLSVSKTQASSKVISVQCFFSIHCVVTSSIVRTTHPYLGVIKNKQNRRGCMNTGYFARAR